MAPCLSRAAGPLHARRILAALLLTAGGLVLPLRAADSSATGSVSGAVQLAPPSRPASPAHLMAESVYPQGASPAMNMTMPPPVAMVYAEPDDDTTRAAVAAVINATPKPRDAIVAQKDLCFIPSMLPVLVGTTVSFPNEDDVYHNVFSYSAAKSFDLGRYRKGENAAKVTFDKTGIVKVFCEIHEHMRCTILVLDTPFFTTTDTAGHYQLSGLPPGHYTLKAWVSDKNTWTSPLVVQAGQAAKSDLAAPPP